MASPLREQMLHLASAIRDDPSRIQDFAAFYDLCVTHVTDLSVGYCINVVRTDGSTTPGFITELYDDGYAQMFFTYQKQGVWKRGIKEIPYQLA